MYISKDLQIDRYIEMEIDRYINYVEMQIQKLCTEDPI